MNIAFDFYCDETPLLWEASKLFDNKINIFGITLAQRYSEIFDNERKLYNIADFLSLHWNSIDISINFINTLERKYNINNLSFFILSDRFLDQYDYEYSLKILVGHFLFYENFFQQNNIDFFIDTPVAILPQLVGYYVAKEYKVKYLAIRVTRDRSAKFTFINDWQDYWYKTQKLYIEGNFDKQLIDNAYKELENILLKQSQPSYMSSPKQFNKIQMSFIIEFLKRLRKYFLQKQYLDKYDYITQNPFWYIKRDLSKILKSKIFNILHNKIFDKINQSAQFYLFPLHLQPEASTLMMAPYYVNQIATIENIAKSLPGNTYLYVKEHTSSYGKHSLNFYKQIKKLPNVKLVSPYKNTKELITNSICPIVLTSTVGWEALLLGKPVVVLGEVFYKQSGLVYTPKNYIQLSYILKHEIAKYQCNKEKLIHFLAAINLASYPGIFSPAQFQESKVLSYQNIMNIYNGIIEEIDYWNNK